jgi:hypothetical protein
MDYYYMADRFRQSIFAREKPQQLTGLGGKVPAYLLPRLPELLASHSFSALSFTALPQRHCLAGTLSGKA